MIITLLGYMGSGKTIVGKELAQYWSFSFFDLDTLIEQELQQKITVIFEKKSEIYFRKIEHKILCKVLNMPDNIVLSLGGGTPCYYDNMCLINRKSISVYLYNSIRNLTIRLKKEKANRPIIKSIKDEKLFEFIAKHLFERQPFYKKAKHILKCDNKSPKELVEEINNRDIIKLS